MSSAWRVPIELQLQHITLSTGSGISITPPEHRLQVKPLSVTKMHMLIGEKGSLSFFGVSSSKSRFDLSGGDASRVGGGAIFGGVAILGGEDLARFFLTAAFGFAGCAVPVPEGRGKLDDDLECLGQ